MLDYQVSSATKRIFNGISARHADIGHNIQFIFQMTDTVTNPLTYYTEIEALEQTITLKCGQTREEHAVKLWLKNAAKSRHSCVLQAEFEAAFLQSVAQHFNLVIKMVFVCTKIFKAFQFLERFIIENNRKLSLCTIWGHVAKWSYISNTSQPWHYVEESSQLHGPTALNPRKEHCVLTE